MNCKNRCTGVPAPIGTPVHVLFEFAHFRKGGIHIDIKCDIKSRIIRSGYTMQQVLALLSRDYGWSDSLSNLSNKLRRGTLRYTEVQQLAQVLGYNIVWQKQEQS